MKIGRVEVGILGPTLIVAGLALTVGGVLIAPHRTNDCATEPCKAQMLDSYGDTDAVGEAQDGPDLIEEDDPRWDCRTMGNQTCGVVIGDQTYLVTFDDGQPVAVTPAGW